MIDSQDIEALNEARKILNRLNEDGRSRAWLDTEDNVDGHDLGRLSEAADLAESLIFNVLNTARSYCHVEISDEEMHLREAGKVEA